MGKTFGDMVMMYNVINGPAPESVNAAQEPHFPCPVANVPAGISPDGMPIGMQ